MAESPRTRMKDGTGDVRRDAMAALVLCGRQKAENGTREGNELEDLGLRLRFPSSDQPWMDTVKLPS